MTCADCAHFHELVSDPVPASIGECRRYPQSSATPRWYGCGEWRAKQPEWIATEGKSFE